MRRTVLLAAVLAAGAMLVTSSQALAIEARATGSLGKKCGTAWAGNNLISEACAILWWDASTHQVSTRCTVRYNFSGVTTDFIACELHRKHKTVIEASGISPGPEDTSVAGQTYTVAISGVEPIPGDSYSAHFEFQASQGGNATGPDTTYDTPFVPITEPLLLTINGSGVPNGTSATGYLLIGSCVLFSRGTITVNDKATDTANLPTVESAGGGGCGRGGPEASGHISSIKLTYLGVVTVSGEVTYTTSTPKKCIYKLTKLIGKFGVPGETSWVTASGTGALQTGSQAGCASKLKISGETELADPDRGEIFSDVLGP
jgi:hypothetical protein